MPITIAICDDDEKQIKLLRKMLNSWSASKPFALDIAEYVSAESFLFSYADNPCDILLLDIEMSGINGMKLAKKLRDKGDMLPIVFITGYSDYISDGYDVEALHYLLKPVNKDKLFAVLDKFADRNVHSYQMILPCKDETIRLSPDRITYIEAQGRKTDVFLSDGRALDCDMSISKLADMNIHSFVRCHRSYLVNLRYVKSIGRAEIELDNGVSIPLSRRLHNEVNASFIKFYKGEKK
ncbi:MAG: LytTR family DNA-binding domain-containing protein [Ruminococcus sp.]|nr:LytTR family DNA-binding domain-containing protein [Ruminococcus sp.]